MGKEQRVREVDMSKTNIEIDLKEREVFGFTSNPQDKEVIKEIVKILCANELSVDRASRILEDARKVLPFLAKLPLA